MFGCGIRPRAGQVSIEHHNYQYNSLNKGLRSLNRPLNSPRVTGGAFSSKKRVVLPTRSAQTQQPLDAEEEEWFPDLQLKEVDKDNATFDVVIAGAGPSGLAVATRVAAAGFKVAVVDPDPLGKWMNNYGVWTDEFEAMGLEDCFDVVWPSATVYLDSSNKGERTLTRPYARVDRPKLKRKLLEQCIMHGVEFHFAKVQDSESTKEATEVICGDGLRLKSTFAVDATGHSKALVKYDGKYDPGYQGAYGITVNVESHPFDVDKMLFMDWRDDHLDDYPELKANNSKYVVLFDSCLLLKVPHRNILFVGSQRFYMPCHFLQPRYFWKKLP